MLNVAPSCMLGREALPKDSQDLRGAGIKQSSSASSRFTTRWVECGRGETPTRQQRQNQHRPLCPPRLLFYELMDRLLSCLSWFWVRGEQTPC